MTTKINVDLAGHATTNGVPAFHQIAAEDSASVANLRAAGAVVIGRTNFPSFLFRFSPKSAARRDAESMGPAVHAGWVQWGRAAVAAAVSVRSLMAMTLLGRCDIRRLRAASPESVRPLVGCPRSIRRLPTIRVRCPPN